LCDVKFDYLARKVFKNGETPRMVLEEVLQKLAHQIIVKESKWTWVREQEMRLLYSEEILNQNPQTIGEFLESYNLAIEILISYSNMGLAPNIEGDETPQEKHFNRELNSEPQGIEELNDTSKPENNTFINALMRKVHVL
jgi:hypothetical protein